MGQNNNIGNQVLGMASGAATGAIMDSFLSGTRSQAQQQHNEAIIAQQEASQKRITKFNSDEAYKQWLRTGDKARAQQLREAGLNVGLMYEGAGGGGSATVSTGGASGGSYEQTNNTGMAMHEAVNIIPITIPAIRVDPVAVNVNPLFIQSLAF